MKLEFQNYSTISKYAFENRYNDFQNTKYQIPNTNYPFDKMEEECGIFGLYSDNEVDTFSFLSSIVCFAASWTRSLRYFCFFSRQNYYGKKMKVWYWMF